MIDLETSLEEDSTRALRGVIEEVRGMPKKEGVPCKFCDMKNVVKTIRDYVVNYSGMVYCVVHHCREVKEINVFEAEMVLLEIMVDPENLSVYEVLKGGYGQYYGVRKTLGILSEEYYSNGVNVLECEHDVESLTYMLYKRGVEVESESLLTLLYLRKEYTRFFRVYKVMGEWGEYVRRLAKSLTLNEDCDVGIEVEECDDIKMDTKSTTLLPSTSTTSHHFSLLIDIKTSLSSCTKEAFAWNEKVRIWFKNRNDSDGSVDKSMVEEAIKSKKWDEAWYISRLGSKGVRGDFHRACVLCLRALLNTKDELWVSRLLDVIEGAMASNKVDLCCEIIDDIFDRIDSIDEQFTYTILREFIRKVSRMEVHERVVSHIIRVIGRLCRTCSGTEACRFCVDHVNTIYSQWKKNNTGGFFFKTHSKYEMEIFENMMDLYCTLNDSGRFVGVCRDLVDNEAKLNRAMCKRIQAVHMKTCPNCGEYSETRPSKIDELLTHLFEKIT